MKVSVSHKAKQNRLTKTLRITLGFLFSNMIKILDKKRCIWDDKFDAFDAPYYHALRSALEYDIMHTVSVELLFEIWDNLNECVFSITIFGCTTMIKLTDAEKTMIDVWFYVRKSVYDSVRWSVYDSVDRSLYNSLRKATLNVVYKQL